MSDGGQRNASLGLGEYRSHGSEVIQVTNILAALAVLILVSACAERVTIPDNDTTPPTVEIRAVSGGQQIGRVSSDGGQESTARVLAGRRVGLLVSGRDEGGVSSLEIRASSGGRLRDATGGDPLQVIKKSGSADVPVDQLTIGTGPVFAEPGSTLRLLARAQDFSTNMAETPILSLEQVVPTEADLRVEPNPLLQGREATLIWSLPGSNVETATITDSEGNVVVPQADVGGMAETVEPMRDTTYTLSIETKIDQAPTPVEDSVTVRVPEPFVELTAAESTVAAGETVEFTYDARGVERVEIPGLVNGSITSFPGTADSDALNETTTYSATGYIGTDVADSDDARVEVEVPYTIELRMDTTEQLSACGQTTSGFELDTQDVTKPFGVYTTVEKVAVPAVNPNTEAVIIYYGPPSVTSSDWTRVGAGFGVTGSTMTDFFDGRDVRHLWCFQWKTDRLGKPGFRSMPVVFTLSR